MQKMHNQTEMPTQPQAAPAWKMFLITTPLAYVLAVGMGYPLGVWWPGLPFLVANGVVVLLLAAALTFVALPLSTRLLHRWLYPVAQQQEQKSNDASPARGEEEEEDRLPRLHIETMHVYLTPAESFGSDAEPARLAVQWPEDGGAGLFPTTMAHLTGKHLSLAVRKGKAARLRRYGMP
jgi:hypothetical protein